MSDLAKRGLRGGTEKRCGETKILKRGQASSRGGSIYSINLSYVLKFCCDVMG